MNILIAAKILTKPNGGVCTHILDLCKYYVKNGHKVLLLADGTDFQTEIDQIDGLAFINMPFNDISLSTPPRKFISIYNSVAKLCDLHEINIIHLHGQCIIPIAYLIRLIKKIPFVWTNHIDAIPQAKILSFMHRFMKFPVISVSKELKEDLMSRLHFKDKRLFVINNGTDTSTYQPLDDSKKALLRQKYNIKNDEFVITQLSRLTYGKGQNLLIRAIHQVQDELSDSNIKLHILFAGTGHQEWFDNTVMKYAAENGIRADYLGFQNPRDIFGISDLAVLPSLYEGFALVVIEALLMGCPVIRSDTPGFSAMQKYCLVFNKGNQQQLVEALKTSILQNNYFKQEVRNNMSEIKQLFGSERMCQDTLNVYKKIIENKYD